MNSDLKVTTTGITIDFEDNGGSVAIWVLFLPQAVAIKTLSGAVSA